MIDYRELPPQEIDEEPAKSADVQLNCSDCDKELPYTYRVEIPTICSHCLQQYSLPSGALVRRNTSSMVDFVKPSPPGFHWDFAHQAHVPDRVVSGTIYAPGTHIHESASHTHLTHKHTNDYEDVAEKPGYKPRFGDSPTSIHDYIVQHYSHDDIQFGYSAIKDQLLYGAIPSDRDKPQVTINLTGREESAILKDKQSETKETLVSESPEMETVFSRPEAEALLKRAAAAMARVDELEAKWSPDLPNGSVIAFQLSFSGTNTYSYAAVKANGQWFTTGRIHGAHPAGVGVGWDVLLECFEKFGASNLQILRTGGETPELPTGKHAVPAEDIPVRGVVLPPGSKRDAFDSEPATAYDPDSGK